MYVAATRSHQFSCEERCLLCDLSEVQSEWFCPAARAFIYLMILFIWIWPFFSLALLSGTLLSLECLTMVKNMAPDVYLHWSFYLSTPKKMPESWKPCCKTVQTGVHKSDTYLFMLILKLLTKLCVAPCMLAELLPLVVLCFQNDWERTDTSSGLTLKV